MQQISRRTKQTRTNSKVKTLADLAKETETESAKNNQGGITTIETIEMTKGALNYSAEYARKPLTQTCLDVQNSKSTYQASQMALTVSLEKYANSA